MSHIELAHITEIAQRAGAAIIDVYENSADLGVTVKADNSPLTIADQKAHDIIQAALESEYPEIPVLSEESTGVPYETRRHWQSYWLVDPLDGTKEFINRNGEFTVNIALIEQGKPVLGLVYVPVTQVTYGGEVGKGAWKISQNQCKTAIATASLSDINAVRIVASRNHRGQVVDELIEVINNELGEVEVVSMGSSLKMCLLAEGAADIYPRLAPTSEWDTAAAHAILRAAGGEIVDTSFRPLVYNQKESLLNPHFIAIADIKQNWEALVRKVL